jgi:hypothetical protein
MSYPNKGMFETCKILYIFMILFRHLKKLRRAEGGAKIFGVFRVKNHDFTPKNLIFPILGGSREIFGVFHVKNHDCHDLNSGAWLEQLVS